MQASNFEGSFDKLFFGFFYEIFTEAASLLLLYHGAKKSNRPKNSNQGGPALIEMFHCSWFGPEPRSLFRHRCSLASRG